METNETNGAASAPKVTLLDRCRTFSSAFGGKRTEIFRVYLPVTAEEADVLLRASRVFVAKRENVPMVEKDLQGIPAGLLLGEVLSTLLSKEGKDGKTVNPDDYTWSGLAEGFAALAEEYPVSDDSLETARKEVENETAALEEMKKFLSICPAPMKPAFEDGIKAKAQIVANAEARVKSLITRRENAAKKKAGENAG